MKDSKLRNFTAVVARILEILAFWAVIACFGATIFMVSGKEIVEREYDAGNLTFQASGFTANIFDESGHLLAGPLVSVMVAVMFCCILMGLIFRNIYRIFRNSNTDSPFSPANVKMVRDIGIYAILIPVVNILVSIIAVIVVGKDGFQASVSLMEVAFGLVVLCLSQFFAYGAQLEKDVDGLV